MSCVRRFISFFGRGNNIDGDYNAVDPYPKPQPSRQPYCCCCRWPFAKPQKEGVHFPNPKSPSDYFEEYDCAVHLLKKGYKP